MSTEAPLASNSSKIVSLLSNPGRLLPYIRGNELAVVGFILLAILLFLAIFGPSIAPFDPLKLNFQEKLQPPSQEHWFGTDEAGRDIFSRVIYGTRISFRVAIIVVAMASGIGVTVGTIAGFYGGRVDDIIMRITDVFMAFPGLILAMALSAAVGASVEAAIFAISFVWWVVYARLARGQVLAAREEVYVQAARSIGVTNWQIIRRHILPNIFPVLLVRMTIDSGYAILFTASLGFIGLGAQEPTPEWGRMVATGRNYILGRAYYSTFPGLAIFITVLAFTWVGDALRDWLDPRLRGSR